MSPGHANATGRLAAAGRSALLASLAVAFVLAGSRAVPVETGFFDLLQRLSATPASVPVVLLRTAADPWSDPALPDILARAHAAGALDLVIVPPPPQGVAPGEVARLQNLLGQEQRAATKAATLARLERQLRDAVGRQGREAALAATLASIGNVIIGIDTHDARTGNPRVDAECEAALARSVTSTRLATDQPRVARLPAGILCQGTTAFGHVSFTSDPDGVTRTWPLALALTEGRALPAIALQAVALGTGEEPAPDGERLFLRYYAPSLARGAFAEVSAADVLAGVDTARLRDHVVVIGDSAPAGALTPLGGSAASPVLVATAVANLLGNDTIARPSAAPAAELTLALVLGLALGLFGHRLPVGTAALGAVLAAAVLLTVEAAAFASGQWFQLASLAIFCLTGTALAQGLRHLPGRRRALAGPAAQDGPAAPLEELDLAFSVLRQQATTGETKARLYDLAMEHGRRRDYARAERVFRHLAARDPGYRDVGAKLEKLTGARLGVAPTPASPPRAQAARPAAPSPATTAAPGSARALGRYQLERVIGRGAMATVYLGRDPTINRLVAIKTVPLAEEFEDGDLAAARGHFLREAESAGRLNHPNIIGIYDAGEDHHVAYLAMEYFEGKPLSYYAQLGRLLPPATVFELMARAADALHYAHGQNVVHRDIKPANILYDDVADALKLVDFGIARLTDSSRTRTGIILGTPSYMSPEQLSASRVTGQSDLYSLGVTMYHLLAGAPPFQADSIPKLMERIAHQAHRPIRDLRDDVPPCADAILDRVLAKNPQDRFPDGRTMAAALRECCNRLVTVPA